MLKKTLYAMTITALASLLFFYGSRSKNAHSETATAESYICEGVTGKPHPWQGSGACAGNASLSISLSELYPGLALHYNSTGLFNPSGFGKNWTLSEVTFVHNFAAPTMVYGNRYQVPLELQTVKWAGKLMAKRRDILNDYFSLPRSSDPALYQQTMDGMTYKYLLSYTNSLGKVFRLAQTTNRYGEVMTVNVGVGLASENITYSDGERVTITRGTRSVVFSRDNVTVTLTLDSFDRLTRIQSTEGPVHVFTYFGNTSADAIPRMLTHSWSEGPGRPTFNNGFAYDSYGKLLTFIDQKGDATVFARNFAARTVETRQPNGQVIVESFNTDRKVINAKTFIVGHQNSPISEVSYSYKANGMLSRMVLPQQTTDYTYDPAEPMLLTSEVVTEGAAVTRRVNYTSEKFSYLPQRQTITRGDGSVVSDVQWNLPPAPVSGSPYLTSQVWDRVSGSYEQYAYAGNTTTVNYFNKNQTLVQTDVYDKRNLLSRTKPLAAPVLKTQIWTYTGDQVSSSTFGGKKTSYTYDTEGRPIIMGLGNGVVVTTSYDENSYVVDETTKYPTGVKEKLTFSRSFYPDKTISIETMTKETLNANGQPANGVGDTTEVHYSDMANGHEVLVTKLNGVENYRR